MGFSRMLGVGRHRQHSVRDSDIVHQADEQSRCKMNIFRILLDALPTWLTATIASLLALAFAISFIAEMLVTRKVEKLFLVVSRLFARLTATFAALMPQRPKPKPSYFEVAIFWILSALMFLEFIVFLSKALIPGPAVSTRLGVMVLGLALFILSVIYKEQGDRTLKDLRRRKLN
jgi:hypothetical protein